jgi:hypothetical protein
VAGSAVAALIFYGLDLADYIDREFGRQLQEGDRNPRATVKFWKHLLRFGPAPCME